jgi:hypothetical protein
MGKHFFHPDWGYWVALKAPNEQILATYPEGTIEVPPRPSPYAEWVNGSWVDHPAPLPSKEEQEALRQVAYQTEADPLFFKAQRGEATLEEWEAKIQEIKIRYPYPSE